MQKESPRLLLIDAFKAIASQCIVLHHLALYGPISEAAQRSLPTFFGWLASDARIAVQVFLVIGGFLAANSLAPLGILATAQPLQQIRKRYLKLIIPFLAAILVCIVVSAFVRSWLVDDAIPGRPTLGQFLAHATLLHGVRHVDSLSAGVWYVAVDFQLFTLLLGLLWAARTLPARFRIGGALALTALVATASLFHFNRNADWDNWAVYFFGAYGIGALSFWFSEHRRSALWPVLIVVLVAAALFVDFRARILVALLTALALCAARRSGLLERWPDARAFAWLGKISYSVFLIHFPVVLLANALFAHTAARNTAFGPVWVLLAWAASIGAGALFHRFVESRSVSYWRALLADPLRTLPARVVALGRPG